MSGNPRRRFFVRGDIWALVGGLFSIGVAGAVRFAVGTAYNAYEAKVLLHSLVSGGLYLVSTIAGASATIIALMLAAIGLIRRDDRSFDEVVFDQLRWISILSAIVLALSIFTLLLMSVPLERADNIPRAWFKGVYYSISSLIATLSGMMIALVIMLLTAVLGIVRSLGPTANAPSVESDPA